MAEFDFVCVGGGLGGLAGAVRAHGLGMSVVVLEKTEWVGGVAAYSGGDIWVPLNHLARAKGLADSREQALSYMAYVGGEGVPFSKDLRDAYVDNIAGVVESYAAAGIEFQLGVGGDAFYPHGAGSVPVGRSMHVTVDGVDLGDWYDLLRPSPYHATILQPAELYAESQQPGSSAVSAEELARREERKFMTRGRGLAGGFLKAALRRDIPIRLGARVVELCCRDDRVSGVIAEADGVRTEYTARRGVLLATGGYGQADYAAALEGLPEYGEQAPPILDGDALMLAETTPAAVVRAGFGYVTLGYESATDVHPGSEKPIVHPILEALGHPHVIAVNPAAQRYGDESVYVTFAHAIGAFDSVTKKYRNFPTYAILDDQFRKAGFEFGWGKGDRWPDAELVRADTLCELAGQLGLNPAALQATVRRFNEFCATGVDADFHRGEVLSARRWGHAARANPNLGPIEQPPFWGCRCKIVGAGIYSHGLSIDAGGRVLSRTGRPVPGLFATGNAVAYSEMPGGYQSGVANGRNMTYAFLAATTAVAQEQLGHADV